MNTAETIGVTVGALAVLGLGVFAYDEIEKGKCTGTWQGLLHGGCVGSVTPGTPATPSFTTLTATTPDANGNSTVTAAWTSSTGATSYTLVVNGQTVYQGPNTSWTGTVNVGVSATSVAGTIAACN